MDDKSALDASATTGTEAHEFLLLLSKMRMPVFQGQDSGLVVAVWDREAYYGGKKPDRYGPQITTVER